MRKTMQPPPAQLRREMVPLKHCVDKMLRELDSSRFRFATPWQTGSVDLQGGLTLAFGTIDPLRTFPLPFSLSDLNDIKKLDQDGPSFLTMSPFGHGKKTILDESVRKSWQIDPGEVRFANGMAQVLESIVQNEICPDFACRLGIEHDLKAVPHKMLIYEEGGMFKTHEDAEKQTEEGLHIATLSLLLPSDFTGGQLRFGPWRRGLREVLEETVNGTSSNTFSSLVAQEPRATQLSWATWFNDIPHELLPVTSGVRVCMVYNLVAQISESDPAAAVAKSREGLVYASVGEVVDVMQHKWIPFLDGEDVEVDVSDDDKNVPTWYLRKIHQLDLSHQLSCRLLDNGGTVDEMIERLKAGWGILPVPNWNAEKEVRSGNTKLSNTSPLALLELDFRYSDNALLTAGLDALKPSDRSLVDKLSYAASHLELRSDKTTPLVVVLARVASHYKCKLGDEERLGVETALILLDKLQLIEGELGALTLKHKIEFDPRTFSGVGFDGERQNLWWPVQSVDHDRWQLGGNITEHCEPWVGNQQMLEEMRREGMVVVVGPPSELCDSKSEVRE